MKYIISIALVMMVFCNFFSFKANAAESEDQASYADARWYFGLAGAANLNFYEGTTHRLTDDLLLPATFHDGFGLKPYASALLEYRFNEKWGINFHLGYDGRGGVFDAVMAPCNLESELETNLGYLVIEPSLRFAPFRSGLHLFAGPRFSTNLQNEFIYKREMQSTQPGDYLEVEDEWSELNESFISFQIGAGYDIMLSSPENQIKYVLTPFISFHPYFGQVPRNIETWSITTIRAGIALKVGRGSKVELPEIVDEQPIVEVVEEPEEPVITEPPVSFSAVAPLSEASVISNEVYPLRNYIFFDAASTSIPGRYNLISQAEALRFREDGMKSLSGVNRNDHTRNQIVVYYNILNILGDRMRNNTNTTITLNGSSAGQGQNVGKQQAEAVKDYLVSVFNIEPNRITTTGSDWPQTRSYRHDQQPNADMRLDSDRRVEILTSSAELLMVEEATMSGILKPVLFSWDDTDYTKDHIVFSLTNAERYMEEWHVTLIGPDGDQLEFGPYRSGSERVPGADVIEKAGAGRYAVQMSGVSKEGLELTRESTITIRPELLLEHNVMHFSILFDINMFDIPFLYERYLQDNIAPFIPENANVIVHGHTDVLGDPVHNHALSLQRANKAKDLIESALASLGITGTSFEVYGFGEMNKEAPYPNRFPEQRFHNRTVVIDIVPR